MNLPNPSDLRKKTQEAIARGKELERKKLLAIKEADERKRKEHELIAETILAQVPHKCEKESENGRSHAIIMALSTNRDYTGYNPQSYKELKGPAAIVWNALMEAKLNPAIESWHDGGGMYGGYNIIVKW